MTLFYYDPIYLEHDTGVHPENAGRLSAVMQRLENTDLLDRCERAEWQTGTPEQVQLAHTTDYAQQVSEYAESGGGQIETDTVVSQRSYEVALRGVGASCDAVQRIVSGQHRNAFCLSRPPGHHALQNAPMGFCLFNNVAIAAQYARNALHMERVLIVDWDVHHGNGTQDIFYRDANVGFLSMHRSPFYPNTGLANETGEGPGEGMTKNLPVQAGTSREEQLELFQRELVKFASHVQPQLVLLSAGFDSHKDDPVGSLGLESEDFAKLTECVLQVAQEHAQGRLVSVLEGGYNPTALAESVEIHLRSLLAAK